MTPFVSAPTVVDPSFAVVIPMYNEEAGAASCVAAVCEELARLPHRCVLIAVNDGSADRTGRILEELAAQQPLLAVVTHLHNQGYGAALRSGVVAAHDGGFTYALFMDSDLTNAPRDIPRFARKMSENLDVLKATRYRRGGGMVNVPWQRRGMSILAGLVARALFRLPLSDCTNGFRAVKTRLLMQMNLRENGFPIIVEELYHCVFLARSYGEIPVVLTNRTSDLRSTAFTYRPSTLSQYLKYCVLACGRVSPRKVHPDPEMLGHD